MQDLRIGVHNTRYRLERWVTPEGESLIGQLPAEIGGVHFARSCVLSSCTSTTMRR